MFTLKEQITPHKIAVLLLIKEYCIIRKRLRARTPTSEMGPRMVETMGPGPIIVVQKCQAPTTLVDMEQSVNGEDADDDFSGQDAIILTEAEMKTFMKSILSVIQSFDLEPLDFVKKVEGFCNQALYQIFIDRLAEMNSTGVQSCMGFFQNIPDLLFMDDTPMVHKASVIGLFVRRMVLSFETLSFSQVTNLYRAFQAYYKTIERPEDISMEDTMDLTGDVTTDVTLPDDTEQRSQKAVPLKHGLYSQRQAEYFILQQSNLLQYNERDALPAAELQHKITDLLHANPNLADAHFLSYLNHLRVDEYCGAVHSLYHYFDRSQFHNFFKKDDKEDFDVAMTKSYRYAILNLAALHFRFGHREEARIALREAMSVAQEYNDHVCLQHAVSWLYRLGESDEYKSSQFLDKAVATSTDLHLSYLASLSIQVFARKVSFEGLVPGDVFDHIVRSDLVNCQHCHSDLTSLSFAQKSSLWTMYGNRSLPGLFSQMCLNLTRVEEGVPINGEASCVALCTLARAFADGGRYTQSFTIINFCRQQFPIGTQFSKTWQLVEQTILHDQSMHFGEWNAIEEITRKIQSMDALEGEFRQGLYAKEIGDTSTAQEILTKLKSQDLSENPAMKCRIILALTELQCQIGNSVNAIDNLLACLIHCKKSHLLYHEAMTYMYLAYVQFCLSLPQQALIIIEANLVNILNLGSVYDKSRCLYLYAKCRVAVAKDKEERCGILTNVSTLLNSVATGFESIGNQRKVKDVFYYQARLYHEMGCVLERNKFAIEFRKLDQLHPTITQMSVNTL